MNPRYHEGNDGQWWTNATRLFATKTSLDGKHYIHHSRHKPAKYQQTVGRQCLSHNIDFPLSANGYMGHQNQPPEIGDWMLKATTFGCVPAKTGRSSTIQYQTPISSFPKMGTPSSNQTWLAGKSLN